MTRFFNRLRSTPPAEPRRVSRGEVGQLVQNVQRIANDDSRSIGECLRNALILCGRLGAETPLRSWLLLELNGYGPDDDLPEYRKLDGIPIKATFIGIAGAILRNYPITVFAFPKEYQPYIKTLNIRQAAPSLEELTASSDECLSFPFPSEVVHVCRGGVLQGMSMTEAWKEVPPSAVRQIIQNVRWRILEMTIELEKDFPPPERGDEVKVDEARLTQVVNQVFNAPVGNVASGANIQQAAVVGLSARDFAALASALRGLGLAEDDISALREAETKDRAEGVDPMKGRVGSWMTGAIQKLLTAGGAVAVNTATQVLPKLVLDYLGIK